MPRKYAYGEGFSKLITFQDGAALQYCDTIIATQNADGSIALNSGGFRTATTKRKINEFIRQRDINAGVYQEKGAWYVAEVGNETRSFFDGIIVNQKGITNESHTEKL